MQLHTFTNLNFNKHLNTGDIFQPDLISNSYTYSTHTIYIMLTLYMKYAISKWNLHIYLYTYYHKHIFDKNNDFPYYIILIHESSFCSHLEFPLHYECMNPINLDFFAYDIGNFEVSKVSMY